MKFPSAGGAGLLSSSSRKGFNVGRKLSCHIIGIRKDICTAIGKPADDMAHVTIERRE